MKKIQLDFSGMTPKMKVLQILVSNISTFPSKVVKNSVVIICDFNVLRGQRQTSTSLLNSCIV